MTAEFPVIAEEEIPRWECWLENTTGIALRGRKRVLEQGIYPRLLACGLDTLDEYQALVDTPVAGPAEKMALIDQLTVKDSSFFRNPQALRAVGEHLRERHREGQDRFRIWSVGCALGQEAWSLAMVAAEEFVHTDVSWQVLGTDISPNAVIHGNRGVYSEAQLGGLSPQRRQHFFEDAAEGKRAVQELREHVKFGASNLNDIEDCPYSNQDVIYCQNVLIYFRPERVEEILDALVERLAPGGLLVIEAGEAPAWTSPRVERWRSETVNAYRLCEWK